ncbi:MAG: hypothetical protein ACLUOI_21900 [Eisenbergiella sp.]
MHLRRKVKDFLEAEGEGFCGLPVLMDEWSNNIWRGFATIPVMSAYLLKASWKTMTAITVLDISVSAIKKLHRQRGYEASARYTEWDS